MKHPDLRVQGLNAHFVREVRRTLAQDRHVAKWSNRDAAERVLAANAARCESIQRAVRNAFWAGA